MLSTFSTFANVLFQYKSPRAEGAKTDPRQGTPMRVHKRPPDNSLNNSDIAVVIMAIVIMIIILIVIVKVIVIIMILLPLIIIMIIVQYSMSPEVPSKEQGLGCDNMTLMLATGASGQNISLYV